MSKWKFQWYKPRTVAFTKCRLRDEPKRRYWEWPLSEGMQVSALPPVWIAMTISCWSVKLLKLPSMKLTHVCGTNSHNWWAKGLPGVGVVKIFYDSDSSGWKSFRLRLHSPDGMAPIQGCQMKSSIKSQTVRKRGQKKAELFVWKPEKRSNL